MKQLHKYWMSIMIRGIIAVVFGVIAFMSPNFGIQLLVLLFGAFAFVDGLVALIVGLSTKEGPFVLEGLVGILVGLFVFFFTTPAVDLFLFVVAVWAFVTGVFEIIASVELRKYMNNEIWMLLAGIISVVFGALLFVNQDAFATIFIYIVGIYAFIFGIFLMALAHTAKNYKARR
jgi:uncharacterized membrane protein HdeD (DUF308 family)